MAHNLVEAQVTPAPAASMEDFVSEEGLWAPVRSGALAPLSGKFVVRLDLGGGRLQRRQELPREAFCLHPRACDIAFALSYRWLSEGHPDPDGFHLAIVARALRIMLERGFEEVGLFWDFGSLYQPPRDQDQEELFKQGLQASNRWYGSTQSVVLLQPQLPPGFSGAAYEKSGWCFVEACISSAIKPAHLRLDLSLLDDTDDLFACMSGRLPPMTPDRVEFELVNNKEFTNKSDVNKVAKLYKNFFDIVSSSVTKLDFGASDWTAKHMSEFVQVLPSFSKLEVLDLFYNKLGDEAMKMLAPALEASDTLKVVLVGGNPFGQDGKDALLQAEQVREARDVPLEISF